MMTRLALLALAFALGTGAATAQQGNPGANFITQWDADEDGIVSLEEVQTRRGDLFTTFDADEDGQLSAEEFVVIDESRTANQAAMQEQAGGGQGRGLMDQEPDRALIDTNADGLVSRDEFLAATALFMSMRDRNGDNQITAEDFGRGG
ncbi:EF-hand domain-containing protein [Neotabrizicola shimadae]|uniref:EF-hand domain-containing protein n=2 Tax=Neotabrizicola shimadae TaxID=2807096 RepID=A0A8G0ZZK5_9RHOB|nr:EF-hand domain-containing protein [Neotabrizicola shimadae]